MLKPKLIVVGQSKERKVISYGLLDLSDQAMTDLRERYVNTYKWFIRKDNRFKYTATNGFLDFGMFDAFDESCMDYNKFIDENDLMNKQYALGVQINKARAKRREKLFPLRSKKFRKTG